MEVVVIFNMPITNYRVQLMQANKHVPEYAQRGSETQGPSGAGALVGLIAWLLVPLDNRITFAILQYLVPVGLR